MATKVKKTRKGNFLSLQEPNFVSLVGQPANRAGFKIFRGDSAAALRASLDAQLDKVLRRKDINPDFAVYVILLPEDIKSRSEAELIQATFGFESDFTLQEEEGRFVLVANNSPSEYSESVTVELGDGFEARLVRADTHEKEELMQNIALVALRFDPDRFIDPAAITEWMHKNEIDCKTVPVDQTEYLEVSLVEGTQRSDMELGVARVEEGILAVVTPSEEEYLPGQTKAIRNYVYGNYGWGATDFAVAVADRSFSEWMDTAISALRNVLEEVSFYSPPEQRTPDNLAANVSRVCLQFASAVSNMAATLPRSTQNADHAEVKTVKTEEQKMPKAEGTTPEDKVATAAASGTTETRSDEQPPAAAVAEPETGISEETTTESTAEEGEIAPVTAALSDAGDSAAKLVTMFGALSASLGELTDSIKSLREDQKTLKADMDKVRQSVEEIGDSSIVRGDLGDPAPAQRSDGRDNPDSVFEGVIFRRS